MPNPKATATALRLPLRYLSQLIVLLAGACGPSQPVPLAASTAPESAPATAPAIASAGQSPASRPADDRPNILLIICDDLTADALGCGGHPFVQTPNIDALAARGVRFRNAAVMTPVCSPSRATILTGRIAPEHGVLRNSMPLADPDTIAARLRAAGYATALIGKYHLGADPGPRAGFEQFIGFAGPAEGGRGDTYRDAVFRVNQTVEERPGYSTDAIVEYAREWIRSPRRRPYFLMVGLKNVHVPLTTPERFANLYTDVAWRWPASLTAPIETLPAWVRGADVGIPIMRGAPLRRCYDEIAGETAADAGRHAALREFIRRYLCNATAADDAVGRILAAVGETGAAERTLVILTSDNGFSLGQRGLLGKHTGYEPSLRVPLIIAPPVRPPSAVRDELVLNLDLFATVLDWAGLAPAPDRPGRSLRPLVEGRAAPWRTDWLIMGQSLHSGNGLRPAFLGVRGQRWKYVRYLAGDAAEELFDLESDPDELRSMASDAGSAGRLAELRARTLALLREHRLPAAWFEPFTLAPRAPGESTDD